MKLIKYLKDLISIKSEENNIESLVNSLTNDEWNQMTAAALMEQIIHGARIFDEIIDFINKHTPSTETMYNASQFKHYNYIEILEEQVELTPEQIDLLNNCRNKSIVNGVTLVLGEIEYLSGFSDTIDLTNDDINKIVDASESTDLDEEIKDSARIFTESMKFIVYTNVLKNDKYDKYINNHDKYFFKGIVVEELYKIGICTKLDDLGEIIMCSDEECNQFLNKLSREYK